MQKYFLHICIGIGLIVVVLALVSGYQFKNIKDLWYVPQDSGNAPKGDAVSVPTTTEEGSRVADPGTAPQPSGKIKADVFLGTLEEVNTGCFADGECHVVVDGKHVTVIMGRSQEVVGKVLGVEGFGDLEKYIGKNVEVYAQVNPDNTYTLYGSEGFYVKLMDGKGTPRHPQPPVVGVGCVIGGCSGQLCVDASKGDVVSTCEWTAAYACYETATCEKQSGGQCGWTPSDELKLCLADAKTSAAVQIQ